MSVRILSSLVLIYFLHVEVVKLIAAVLVQHRLTLWGVDLQVDCLLLCGEVCSSQLEIPKYLFLITVCSFQAKVYH